MATDETRSAAIPRENYSDNGDLMGTAPLGAEEILARIEAREARDATS